MLIRKGGSLRPGGNSPIGNSARTGVRLEDGELSEELLEFNPKVMQSQPLPPGHWYLHNSFCPLSPDELAAMVIASNSRLFGKFIGGEGRVRGLNGRSHQPLTLTLSPSVRTQKTALWKAVLCELTGRGDKICRYQCPEGEVDFCLLPYFPTPSAPLNPSRRRSLRHRAFALRPPWALRQ